MNATINSNIKKSIKGACHIAKLCRDVKHDWLTQLLKRSGGPKEEKDGVFCC